MRITPLGAPPPERFSNGGAQLEISWILEPQFCMDHPRRWYHHAFRSSSGLSSSPNRPRSHQLLLIASLLAIVCVGAVTRGVEFDLRRPFVKSVLTLVHPKNPSQLQYKCSARATIMRTRPSAHPGRRIVKYHRNPKGRATP